MVERATGGDAGRLVAGLTPDKLAGPPFRAFHYSNLGVRAARRRAAPAHRGLLGRPGRQTGAGSAGHDPDHLLPRRAVRPRFCGRSSARHPARGAAAGRRRDGPGRPALVHRRRHGEVGGTPGRSGARGAQPGDRRRDVHTGGDHRSGVVDRRIRAGTPALPGRRAGLRGARRIDAGVRGASVRAPREPHRGDRVRERVRADRHRHRRDRPGGADRGAGRRAGGPHAVAPVRRTPGPTRPSCAGAGGGWAASTRSSPTATGW